MIKASHEEYVKTIKDAATRLAVEVLIREVPKRLPFLFIPVLNPIVTLLLKKIVEILITQTEFAIFFSYIDLRVDAQGRKFATAALENRKAQLSGTPEEKKIAEENLIKSFRNLAILSS
jgi:hypothetical protein